MDINYLRHMLVFTKVVESGGITAAASNLQVSKSVVSQQLKALEQKLGVALINRSTRSQVLTPAGELFYSRCQPLNQIATEAWNDVQASEKKASGRIRVSAPNALIGPIVAPALGKLVANNKGVLPTLLGSDSHANLISDDIHLAIRVGKMPNSDYKQRKVGQFRDVLCASPQYLQDLAITQDALLSGMVNSTNIDYVANSWQGKHITHHIAEKAGRRSLSLKFSANRFCDSLPAVVAMASEGCGFAYIPDFVFHQYQQSGHLVEVMPDFLCEAASVYAVHAYSGAVPLLVKQSIEAISQQLEELLQS